jgi:hypothetical protein
MMLITRKRKMRLEDRLSLANKTQDETEEALQIALNALQWFADNETFVYEGSTDWPLSVSDKAQDAINEIKELLE